MYPLERLREIRELELFLFGGVPETPEPTYERDVHGFSGVRFPHCDLHDMKTESLPQGEVVGWLEYHRDTGEVVYREGTSAEEGP